MAEIIILTDNKAAIKETDEILRQTSHDYKIIQSEVEIKDIIEKNRTDVIMFDCNSTNIDIVSILRKHKITMQTKDIRSIVLLPENNINYDILKFANAYINRPFDENLFKSTLNSNLQLSETLRILSKNNKDLAKSLYQLNVLYNTGTQLSGSFDKTKLIEIMLEGLDQSLSLSLTYALILNDANDIKLMIKSVFPVSTRLENAIKLRALLNYKNLFSINPSIENIKITKEIKDKYGEFDLNIFGYDNLMAPINIKNKFYGIIEVFRQTDFAPDDTKCFTTLVKQVSLPLESAILYEEIKLTNIKLEKLERLKSEFISIVSHELRTPLTSINSALEIIQKGSAGEINETMDKFLNLAKRNVKRLSAIIYDLLDLSKIEAGKMEFRFEKTNINLTVELVKNSLESLAKEQNITITTNLSADAGTVYIDTQRMEQVITNLVSNAIKFTKENGNIEIRSKKISAEVIRSNPFFENLPEKLSKEYIEISVKDNGIGIARENWSKVFEQFKQIENSLSRKVGGSGLGLPIAKRLMEAHKGFIWLDSELNKGTTFYLAVPLMNDEEIYTHSLEQEMQKAKSDKRNIAIIKLKEKANTGNSVIDKILKEDIIRKTAVYKDFSKEENGIKYYDIYTADIDSFVYDFEKRRLETYIREAAKENPECGIMYSSALYPQDGETIKKINKKLEQFSKGDTDEENIIGG